MLERIFKVEGEALLPYFQGLFDRNKKKVGSELLIRGVWGNSEIITPDKFLPEIERSGLITSIDLWSFMEAFWWQKRNSHLQVSCNVSGRSLESPAFAQQIKYLTHKYQIDPQKIDLELTESSVLTPNAAEIANSIVRLGYRLVLDDWGKEYSGYNRLCALPIEKLKIDRYLIGNLTTPDWVVGFRESQGIDKCSPRKASAIVKSTIELAKRLKIEVVAEGVETEQQFELLKFLGCNYFQGFLLEKPHPDTGAI